MTREMIFHKYCGMDSNYLIYDINKNKSDLSREVFHKIHNRNFGLDLDGILVGPYVEGQKLYMKVYDPDGARTEEKRDDVCVFSRYLKDAGYGKIQDYTLHTADGNVRLGMLDETAAGDMMQTKIYCWC